MWQGQCLDDLALPPTSTAAGRHANKISPQPANGNYSCPKVRDRLCQIIRQHQLDPKDFGYDTELMDKDEIDDKALVGLKGIVKISHVIVHGLSLLNLDGLAAGKSSRRQILPDLRLHDDLQLHPDQPVPSLPTAVPAPISGRMVGEGHASGHAVWPSIGERNCTQLCKRLWVLKKEPEQ